LVWNICEEKSMRVIRHESGWDIAFDMVFTEKHTAAIIAKRIQAALPALVREAVDAGMCGRKSAQDASEGSGHIAREAPMPILGGNTDANTGAKGVAENVMDQIVTIRDAVDGRKTAQDAPGESGHIALAHSLPILGGNTDANSGAKGVAENVMDQIVTIRDAVDGRKTAQDAPGESRHIALAHSLPILGGNTDANSGARRVAENVMDEIVTMRDAADRRKPAQDASGESGHTSLEPPLPILGGNTDANSGAKRVAENVIDQIVTELRQSGAEYYPQHGEIRSVRIVGRTPKTDHYIYDIVLDFAKNSERLAAKVYRTSKCGAESTLGRAKLQAGNLERAYQIFRKKNLDGVPRPIGEFSELGAVVAEKLSGEPLQAIIIKAALLPDYADPGTLAVASAKTGEWLRVFHKATADMPVPFEPNALLADLEKLCDRCRGEGLDDVDIRTILSGARGVLARSKKTMPSSAVLNDLTPLNVIVGEHGIGICDYAKMSLRGCSFNDVALFMASVEALEKYPFCKRAITGQIQEEFLGAYGAGASDLGVLRVLKIKALLGMFAQGRCGVKEGAIRRKVMWATVMKRCVQQAAQRSLAPAA
jgi:hypothetical protein